MKAIQRLATATALVSISAGLMLAGAPASHAAVLDEHHNYSGSKLGADNKYVLADSAFGRYFTTSADFNDLSTVNYSLDWWANWNDRIDSYKTL